MDNHTTIFTQEPSSSSSSSLSSSSSNRSSSSIVLASARPKKRAGRRVFKETRHPVFRGVRRRNNDKWVCEVRVPNDKKSRIWLGTYATPEMAARAHDVAALALRGESACLNFADSACRLSPMIPASASAVEIRRVASLAAHAFHDPKNDVVSSTNTTASDDSEVCSGTTSLCVVRDHDYELNDLLLGMADEPLRSPTHRFLQYGQK
ncbi:dehydration-responsive element-binding protein 1E-like [Senna tora]|uniref:Dehydration-responsive element-binding protein 1E-like n=1 Tax=Senna tora TaxID=362788 RepID=A0A834W5L6_9FABA|nr:dehydration-responsive element-binding protein 1E-like [Senna tora]